MPMLRLWAGVRVMSEPPTSTAPESANSKPAAMRSAVVLPQPEGPSRRDELALADVEVETLERDGRDRTSCGRR